MLWLTVIEISRKQTLLFNVGVSSQNHIIEIMIIDRFSFKLITFGKEVICSIIVRKTNETVKMFKATFYKK